MSTHVSIGRVTADQIRPYRLAWLRRGTPSRNVAFPGDDAGTTVHLLARDPGGRPAGIASWMESASPDRPDQPALQLRGMAVAPELRRLRVGADLIEAGMTLAAERGLDWVWANARDSALSFYVAQGFDVVGEGFTTADTHLPHHRILRAVRAI